MSAGWVVACAGALVGILRIAEGHSSSNKDNTSDKGGKDHHTSIGGGGGGGVSLDDVKLEGARGKGEGASVAEVSYAGKGDADAGAVKGGDASATPRRSRRNIAPRRRSGSIGRKENKC
jgi:hypothetical protein